MSASQELIEFFAEKFPSSIGYYYQLLSFGRNKDGSKFANMRRVVGDPELEDYADHLNGKVGLSLVSIENSKYTSHGEIDVDVYPVDPVPYLTAALRWRLPLVGFRTKSEGLHLRLSLRQPVLVTKMQNTLFRMASAIGLEPEQIEIFPKQQAADEDSLANGLNLPLFGETRPLLRIEAGDMVEIRGMAALEYIETYTVDEEELDEIVSKLPEAPVQSAERSKRRQRPYDKSLEAEVEALNETTTLFPDGPACLQRMEAEGKQGEGGRNDLLREIAVYARYVNPDSDSTTLVDELMGFNYAMMQKPLPSAEVAAIAKSVIKKGPDIGYRCKSDPLNSYCMSGICKMRRYGAFQRGQDLPFHLEVETPHDLRAHEVDNTRVYLCFESPRSLGSIARLRIDNLLNLYNFNWVKSQMVIHGGDLSDSLRQGWKTTLEAAERSAIHKDFSEVEEGPFRYLEKFYSFMFRDGKETLHPIALTQHQPMYYVRKNGFYVILEKSFHSWLRVQPSFPRSLAEPKKSKAILEQLGIEHKLYTMATGTKNPDGGGTQKSAMSYQIPIELIQRFEKSIQTEDTDQAVAAPEDLVEKARQDVIDELQQDAKDGGGHDFF